MLAMQVREILRMEKKIVVIHTSFISVDTLKSLFGEIIPEAKVYNIVDDSMLPEIMSSCGVTENVIKRYCAYARQAEVIGLISYSASVHRRVLQPTRHPN